MTEFKKKVDTDWKRKAQQEKELLARKKAAREQEGPEDDGVGFADILRTFAMQAQMALGAPDPSTGAARPDPHAARYLIGMLEVLKAKTKGNLQPDEQAMLDRLLSDLKMAFSRLMG